MLRKLLPYVLTAILLFTLVLSGCGRSGVSGGGGGLAHGVYVGGGYVNSNGVYTACYWDPDGTRHDLGDGSSPSEVLCLSIYSDKLYVVGSYFIEKDGSEYVEKSVPCYWIDGRRYDLVNPDIVRNDTCVTCGFVYKGRVYAAGDDRLDPYYWDGDEEYQLSKPDEIGMCTNSIFANGDGVYVAGSENASPLNTIYYWENGVLYEIDRGEEATAYEIIVVNDSIYVGGQINGGACYWVRESDGEPMTKSQLDTTGSGVTSIFVQDKVYSGGFYTENEKIVACYWVNEEKSSLEPNGDESFVESIIVYDNQVYAAGYTGADEKTNACYWDSKGRHDLDDGDSDKSWANCILVW